MNKNVFDVFFEAYSSTVYEATNTIRTKIVILLLNKHAKKRLQCFCKFCVILFAGTFYVLRGLKAR